MSMATSLASQLRKLREEVPLDIHKKTFVSLLFDRQQASALDTSTIWAIGREGVEELCKLDERFAPFEDSLFSSTSRDFDRQIQSKEINTKLDKTLTNFLNLLSPFFLLRSSHKAIEYLIRKYSIEQYNVESIMACILPYHETNIFARMVQLLRIKKTSTWSFLSTNQKTGAPLLHDILIQRCINDVSLLEFICQHVKAMAKAKLAFKTLLSFYASTLTQVISKAPMRDNFLVRVTPFIFAGLKSNHEEYQVASYMIISQLSSRSTLSPELLDSCMEVIAKNASEAVTHDALLCMVYLCQTQTVHQFPVDAVNSLSHLRNLTATLTTLIDKGYDIDNFLHALLASLLSPSDFVFEPSVYSLLKHVVQEVPVLSTHVPHITAELLRLYTSVSKTGESNDLGTQISELLHLMDAKYPQALDLGMSAQLQTIASNSEEEKILFNFISLTLGGTRHHIISESSTTLCLSLQHPETKIRLLALNQLEMLMGNSVHFSSSDNSYLRTVLVQRLCDDKEEVVTRTLQIKQLSQFVEPDALLQKLEDILYSPEKSEATRSHALRVLLESEVLVQMPAYQPRILCCLLSALLVSPLTRSFNVGALRAATKLKHPLLTGIHSVWKPNMEDVEINKGIISTLAGNLQSAWPVETILTNEHTHLIAMLILNKALSDASEADYKMKIIHLLMPIVMNRLALPLLLPEASSLLPLTLSSPHGFPVDSLLTKLVERRNPLVVAEFSLGNILNNMPPVDDITLPILSKFYTMIVSKDSASFALFSGHLLLLFQVLKDQLLGFLSTFWTAGEEHSSLVQARSLGIANSFLASVESSKYDFQIALPPFLIALVHPSQVVRSAAIRCMSTLQQLQVPKPSKKSTIWTPSGNSSTTIYGTEYSCALPSELFSRFLDDLVASKEEFLVDPTYLRSLLSAKLSKASEQQRLLARYLISYAIHFPTQHATIVLLESMKEVILEDKLALTLPLLKRLLSSSSHSAGERKILHLLLQQISPSTATFLNQIPELFATLINILHHPDASPTSAAEDPTVRTTTLSIISPDLFDALSPSNQATLFSALFDTVLKEKSPAVKSEAVGTLNGLAVPAELVLPLLQTGSTAANDISKENKKKKKKLKTVTEESESLAKDGEQLATFLTRVSVVCELLIIQKQFLHLELLVSPLFAIIADLLERRPTLGSDVSDSVEYTSQVILSALSRITESLSSMTDSVTDLEGKYNVELLIHWLRGITKYGVHVRSRFQEHSNTTEVLNHLMALFTFMGVSVLQQDDNYTFHLIQKVLDATLPTLQHGVGVEPLLKIFADAFANIPAHRRLPLYTRIMKILSSDCLVQLLFMLFTKQADSVTEVNTAQFCHDLCNQFDPAQTVQTFIDLVQYLLQIPYDEEELRSTKLDFYDVGAHNMGQLCSLKQAVVEFITDHIASKDFLDKLLAAEKEPTDIQPLYLKLFELLLMHLQKATEQQNNVKKRSSQWKGMIESTYVAIDNLNQLLSVPAFIQAIAQLLQHKEDKIRRRALILFNEKIANEKDTLTDQDVDMFIKMINSLLSLLKENTASNEADINKQSALLSLEILARNFAQKRQSAFERIVPSLIPALRHPNSQVKTSAVICLATITAELGTLMAIQLPKFFPMLLKIIQGSFGPTNEGVTPKTKERTLSQLSALSSMEVIVAHTAKFLHPYLRDLVISITHPNVVSSSDKITSKVKSILTLLASHVDHRVLLVPTLSCYPVTTSYDATEPVVYLLHLIADICTRLNRENLAFQYKSIFEFFVGVFDYRNRFHSTRKLSGIDDVENSAISAFVLFTVKLNETLFKPLFLSMVDWATNKNNLYRCVTFYRVVEAVADKLKSLFVPYFGYILDNCVARLQEKPEEHGSEHSQLVRYMLSSLYRCFLYDTEGFMNKDKFDVVLPALVKQLEDVDSNYEEYEDRMKHFLVPCIAQLAVCVGNDALWKPLNYQVLLKTRSESAKVRYMSLLVLQECYTKLGEELLVLLPETIPFLAELMEDSDPRVEKLAHEVVKLIEQYLGSEAVLSYR